MTWTAATAAFLLFMQQGAAASNANFLVQSLGPRFPMELAPGVSITKVSADGPLSIAGITHVSSVPHVLTFDISVSDAAYAAFSGRQIDEVLTDTICHKMGGSYIEMGVVTTFVYTMNGTSYSKPALECQALSVAGYRTTVEQSARSQGVLEELQKSVASDLEDVRKSVDKINRAASADLFILDTRKSGLQAGTLTGISVENCALRLHVDDPRGTAWTYEYGLNDIGRDTEALGGVLVTSIDKDYIRGLMDTDTESLLNGTGAAWAALRSRSVCLFFGSVK